MKNKVMYLAGFAWRTLAYDIAWPAVGHEHSFFKFGVEWRGDIGAHYSQIVKIFGKPTTNGRSEKSDALWLIETPYGPVELYNHKNGWAYLGRRWGLPVEDITDWCYVCFKMEAIAWVTEQLAD